LKPKNTSTAEREPDADKPADASKPKTVDEQLKDFEDGTREHHGFGPLNRDLGRLMEMAGTADGKPSEMLQHAVTEQCAALDKKLSEWKDFVAHLGNTINVKAQEGCSK
jgi:hypothetical protein